MCGYADDLRKLWLSIPKLLEYPEGFNTVYYFNSFFLGLNKNLRDEKFRIEILGDSFSILNQDINGLRHRIPKFNVSDNQKLLEALN